MATSIAKENNRLTQAREWLAKVLSGDGTGGRLLYGGIGIFIILGFSVDLCKDYFLQRYGVDAQAVLINTYIPMFSKGDSYRVHYSFKTTSGQQYVGNGPTSESSFHELKAGDPVAIHYVSFAPSISRNTVTFNNTDIIDMFIILIFGFPIGLWLLLSAIRRKSDKPEHSGGEADVSNDP